MPARFLNTPSNRSFALLPFFSPVIDHLLEVLQKNKSPSAHHFPEGRNKDTATFAPQTTLIFLTT